MAACDYLILVGFGWLRLALAGSGCLQLASWQLARQGNIGLKSLSCNVFNIFLEYIVFLVDKVQTQLLFQGLICLIMLFQIFWTVVFVLVAWFAVTSSGWLYLALAGFGWLAAR